MKKKHIAALAGLAAVFAVGGSLAYFNQNLEAVNVLSVGKFDTTVHEDFKPITDWEPGAEVKKEVRVVNDGNVPAVARVWFVETWTTADGQTNSVTNRKTDENNELLPGEDLEDEGNDLTDIHQEDPSDGEIAGDQTVVEKTLSLGKGWEYNQKDGCYYYTSILEGETETPPLLEKIRLTENADMGHMVEKKFYATTEEQPDENSSDWVQFSPNEEGEEVSEADLPDDIREEVKYFRSTIGLETDKDGNPIDSGYAGAEYTLSVIAQTVQATEDAVEAEFGPMAVQAAKEGKWAWNFLGTLSAE